jgi:hypothetical protein
LFTPEGAGVTLFGRAAPSTRPGCLDAGVDAFNGAVVFAASVGDGPDDVDFGLGAAGFGAGTAGFATGSLAFAAGAFGRGAGVEARGTGARAGSGRFLSDSLLIVKWFSVGLLAAGNAALSLHNYARDANSVAPVIGHATATIRRRSLS